jgi:hypothetical protein
MTGQEGDEPRQRRRTLRLTCSLTADFRIRAPNRAMCEVLGYTYAELDLAPSWALLRPHDIPLASEPDAHPKLIAVRNGEIAAETYTSWMESKDGKRIDFDATWTWNPINLEWDIVMEVEDTQAVYVEYDIDTELDTELVETWITRMRERQQRVQERVRQAALRQTALRVEDMYIGALSTADQERETRKVIREMVQEEVLQIIHARPTKAGGAPGNPPRGGGPRPKYDSDALVREIARVYIETEDAWALTVEAVSKKLDLSVNGLKGSLIRYKLLTEGERLKDVVHRIGMRALEALDH